MKKINLLFFVYAVTTLSFLKVSYQFSPAFAEEKTMHFRFSIEENEAHPQGVLAKTFKKNVEEMSNGNITVDVFYNSTLYAMDPAIQAIRAGDSDMTIASMQKTAEYLPSISMLTSTFIFRDYEHARRVLDGEIGQTIFSEMATTELRYIPLGFFYNGARQLNLRTSKEVKKPEDLRETILRMPAAETWITAGESLGAKVTPMDYSEVYMALASGTIDAQDNPLPAVKTAKFYEVTKQICMTSHIINMELVIINTNVWNSMTSQQKKWMHDAATAAIKEADQTTIKEEAELLDFFASQGLKIVYPDHDAFISHALKYYQDNGLTQNWNMDMYREIQMLGEAQ